MHVDEGLPEGAVVDGELATADVDHDCDYVVVGTGASGAVAAHTLARAGYRVAMVEEGPWVKTRDFGEDVFAAFRRMMRDGGTQASHGRSFIPVLQGRCVGGGTVVNSAIAWRVPEDVIDDWGTRFGLADTIGMHDLDAHYDALETELSVRPVADEALGENNRRFIEAMRAHGLEVDRMRRYDKGCKGSARCLTGCPNGAKQGMNVSYVPWALRLGARIYTSTRVDRIMFEGRRATGILARTTSTEPDRTSRHVVRLRARCGVIVAASTVQTPNLLRRSGIRAKDLGEHFMAHPGVGVGGVMKDPVHVDFGATQGAESIAFRVTDHYKLETLSMPPELCAARMPGAGADLVRRMAQYPNVTMWAANIRCSAEGQIRPAWGGGDNVRFTPNADDMQRTRRAAAFIARLQFEHGASEIWPGIFGLPSVMTSIDEVRKIDEGPLDPRAYGFVATHLFGTARMGPDASRNVVRGSFETYAADGLYVVDSSVFPTNLGVNPQHTIMAVARLAATRIAGARTTRAAV